MIAPASTARRRTRSPARRRSRPRRATARRVPPRGALEWARERGRRPSTAPSPITQPAPRSRPRVDRHRQPRGDVVGERHALADVKPWCARIGVQRSPARPASSAPQPRSSTRTTRSPLSPSVRGVAPLADAFDEVLDLEPQRLGVGDARALRGPPSGRCTRPSCRRARRSPCHRSSACARAPCRRRSPSAASRRPSGAAPCAGRARTGACGRRAPTRSA